MPRQRIGLTHSWATTLGQKLMVIPAVALIYGGGVVLALGAGLSPKDLDAATGYQTVYERLGALDPANWSQPAAIAAAGIAGFLVFMALGWAQRLIPHVTRSAIVLREEDDGRTTVSPRAVERAAEIAARHRGVKAAKATLGDDDLHIAIHARRADQLSDVLRHAKASAADAIALTEVGDPPRISATVTRFTPASKKELLK